MLQIKDTNNFFKAFSSRNEYLSKKFFMNDYKITHKTYISSIFYHRKLQKDIINNIFIFNSLQYNIITILVITHCSLPSQL